MVERGSRSTHELQRKGLVDNYSFLIRSVRILETSSVSFAKTALAYSRENRASLFKFITRVKPFVTRALVSTLGVMRRVPSFNVRRPVPSFNSRRYVGAFSLSAGEFLSISK